jgi:hypothetical protein
MTASLMPGALWESDRIISPGSATEAARWPTATVRPGLPRGHHFRAQRWSSVADVAEETGLRFRHDVRAAFARLAARRSLGVNPFCVVELAFA